MQHAKKLSEDFGYDAAFVEYLRISSEIHDDIQSTQTPSQLAQKYYELGQVYEVLKDAGFWDVPLVYYEACIKEYPRSAVAKDCFKQVEQEITLGFTGALVHLYRSQKRNI
ncbi:MAG: hypothetical protein R2827_04255 [Bdellovibrionales bacterium]